MPRPVESQGGGFSPPPGGYGPPGGYPPGQHGGYGAAPPPPSGFGGKPITGSPHSIAMHALTIDPRTGLPRGEKPPASTAAVVALVCGILLCLGPLTGMTAIVAGLIGRQAAREQPASVGGGNMSLAGLLLGVLNLLLCAALALLAMAGALG